MTLVEVKRGRFSLEKSSSLNLFFPNAHLILHIGVHLHLMFYFLMIYLLNL